MLFLAGTLLLSLLLGNVAALGQKKTIAFASVEGAVALFAEGGLDEATAGIVVDGNDWPGVIRAAKDLSLDFKRVTGTALSVLTLQNTTTLTAATTLDKKTLIVIGTIGKSALVDDLVSRNLLSLEATQGKWEAYESHLLTTTDDALFPGAEDVTSILVIAGSDKRGAIYGIYDLSEQLGVSPWHYWADVPTRAQSAVYALPTRKIQASPSVKYRGIFLNDEQPALSGWVKENFESGKYGLGYGVEFYSRVFELLLRLRANLLWPTMWDGMFAVDDEMNQWNADMYGVVMSTSHTEPLSRSTKEWNTLGNGTWDYSTNSAAIKEYWKEGVQRGKKYEHLWTMGMRGNGDNVLSEELVTELLEGVVADQRAILKEVLEVDDAGIEKVPQVWCLYKDIQAYYESGLVVPEDITLLWADDNWGNIRRLPMANETSRKGGAGVYYHFDYVGDPRDYKWINTNQLQKTWEQMTLAYERHARQIWIVNVGDLKPLELPIDYFMSLAYDIDTWGPINKVGAWTEAWAEREFGAEVAKETADIVDLYGTYAARRRFELVQPDTYSVINYREAEERLAEWDALVSRAEAVHEAIDEATQPAFFQLVLHPARAGRIFYHVMINSARNNLYANQRRNSANQLADLVREQFQADADLTDEYHALLGGKWNHMMDQTHFGYQYWQQPMRNTLPPLAYTQTLQTSLAGSLGVSIESSNGSIPGDDRYNTVAYGNDTLVLPALDPYGPPSRWIEIFSKGADSFSFELKPHNPWVHVVPSKGFINSSDTTSALQQVRVEVSVDWASAPEGYNIGFIDIVSSTPYGNFGRPSVNLPINKTSVPASFTNGFVETGKYISIEAEHTSRRTTAEGGAVHYEVINRLGRTLSGVTLYPRLAASQTPGPTAAALEYDLYLFTTPAYGANITLSLGGALNQDPSRPLRYAIQLDDSPIQTVAFVPYVFPMYMPAGWERSVADGNTWTSTTTHKVAGGGRRVLRVWAVEPGVVVQKIVVDLGGVRASYLGPPETRRL
ncbi:hypothetical protein DFH27DRAFT_485299 [Peziza echinospora]|nr:hypothetical protein DFH27DRAFT_485299 [Peziza echinospora]